MWDTQSLRYMWDTVITIHVGHTAIRMQAHACSPQMHEGRTANRMQAHPCSNQMHVGRTVVEVVVVVVVVVAACGSHSNYDTSSY